ncbi:MAG: polyphosphate kinase 2 [Proteobacteria bacterium]|nr:polyphosphate kinase 2 [Pseudomonadota bacterium]
MSKHEESYEDTLVRLQTALVDTQIWAMDKGLRMAVVLEGRDAAGKDGTIRRVTEHLSARNTRVVALPKPSNREEGQWWLQRYVNRLPTTSEWVLFNRSWYNRAGVEKVMGFSTEQQQEEFLRNAPDFERMLVESGIILVKLWLDISREEQAKRLKSRRSDPLKRLKTSKLDEEAQKRWDDYSKARNDMLMRTHSAVAPWTCVRADHKKTARLNVIRHLIRTLDPPELSVKVERPDPEVLFPFEAAALEDGRLAP